MNLRKRIEVLERVVFPQRSRKAIDDVIVEATRGLSDENLDLRGGITENQTIGRVGALTERDWLAQAEYRERLSMSEVGNHDGNISS